MRVVYLNKVRMDAAIPAVNFSILNAYGLAQAGAECWLLAQTGRADLTPERLLREFAMEDLPRFHLELIPRTRRLGIRTNQWFYLDAYRRIARIHREAPLAAVISRDPGALPYLVWIRRRLGIPVYYQPHNFYVDLSLRPDVNPKNARKYRWLETTFVPRMSGLLCLQESQAAWYRKYFPDLPVHAAMPGLLRTAFSERDRFAEKLVVYVGALKREKGIGVLIDAFARLGDPAARLGLVGGRDDGEVAHARALVEDAGLAGRVEITGWISPVEVGAWLDRAAVGVIPLKDDFYNRYLTAPNKLFDYLSRGIPVVASDLPAVRDFLPGDDDGGFFAPGDAASLAAALGRLLSDRPAYDAYAQRSRELAGTFLWSRRGRIMLDFIRPPRAREH